MTTMAADGPEVHLGEPHRAPEASILEAEGGRQLPFVQSRPETPGGAGEGGSRCAVPWLKIKGRATSHSPGTARGGGQTAAAT